MKNKAFTLIELLITIAIISLLSSIVFASLSSAREKAQITKANVELKEVKKAVELTRLSSTNSSLPIQTDITKAYNETTATTVSAYSTLSEVLPTIPETGNIINGGSEAEKNYIYISNGNSATDSSGNDYYCDGELNEYAVLYKRIGSGFRLYSYVGTPGIFDEYGNSVAYTYYSPGSISPIEFGSILVMGYNPAPMDSLDGAVSTWIFGGEDVGYYVCI